MLLTGRLSRARFLAGAGVMEPGTARFNDGDTAHTFTLDQHGLPSGWLRASSDGEVMRVVFRQYLELPPGQGGPLRLPRKVRVEQEGATTSLVLGVRRFQPGAGPHGPLPAPDALPGGARDFHRAPLPEQEAF